MTDPKLPYPVTDAETVKRATEAALGFWRRCRRRDLNDEDKVRGALLQYQMALDASALIGQLGLTHQGEG